MCAWSSAWTLRLVGYKYRSLFSLSPSLSRPPSILSPRIQTYGCTQVVVYLRYSRCAAVAAACRCAPVKVSAFHGHRDHARPTHTYTATPGRWIYREPFRGPRSTPGSETERTSLLIASRQSHRRGPCVPPGAFLPGFLRLPCTRERILKFTHVSISVCVRTSERTMRDRKRYVAGRFAHSDTILFASMCMCGLRVQDVAH